MIQYCTFHLGKDLFGVDILGVQEITRGQEITPVPHAPGFVKGLINLRGQIVVTVSLRSLFRLGDFPPGIDPINIILALDREPLSLMADRAGDVVEFPPTALTEPPHPLSGPGARLIRGVHRMSGRMLHVLEPAAIFPAHESESTRNPGVYARQEVP